MNDNGTRAARGIFRTVAVTAAALALILGSSIAGAEPGDNGAGQGGEQSSSAAQGQGKPSSDTNSPQPPSNADYSGNGANVHGPYDSDRKSVV